MSIANVIGKEINTAELMAVLQKEGIIFESKTVFVTLTGRNIKSKYYRALVSKNLSLGKLITTSNRIVCLIGKYQIVNIPKKDPLFQFLEIRRINNKRFNIAFDLTKFPSGIEGKIELSYWLDPGMVNL